MPAGHHVVGLLWTVELARAVMPEREQADPAGRQVHHGAAPRSGQILPDIGVVQIGPALAHLAGGSAGGGGVFSVHEGNSSLSLGLRAERERVDFPVFCTTVTAALNPR
ncbi:hypothetical protein ARTHRO9AX_20123 [Arthrobacter sp. 9AX]|nr:hypothetical protein ARTHRO9AX_20123 [Arthrobacter sp. 9AX]